MTKILGFIVGLITATAWGASPMTNTVKVDEFQVVGISARTNNAAEMTQNGVISKMWGQFFKEGVLGKIPNKIEPTIFAIYTDYESDRNGEYTFLIGAKVSRVEKLPTGLVAKKIPAGQYSIIPTAKGPVSQVVPKAWQKIWSLEDSKEIHRAYGADFEVYDQRATDPNNSQVDIYVGVK
jgi:predicted transcriptional regulator YdeE